MFVFSTGWDSRWWRRDLPALSVRRWLTPLVTIRWAAGGTGTGSSGLILSGMNFFSAAHSAALASRREVLSLIPDSSSHPCSGRLPPKLEEETSCCPRRDGDLNSPASHPYGGCYYSGASTPAAACLEVGVAFISLVVQSFGGWSDDASKIISNIGRLQRQRLGIPPVDSICHLSSAWPSHYGEGMPPCWFAPSPLDLLRLTGLFSCSCRCVFILLF